MIDAPFIDQRGGFPTGCEAVSAVMALWHAGVAITVDQFIDQYLPQGQAPAPDAAGHLTGADPALAFPGSPRDPAGWGCFAPVIVTALDRALGEKGPRGARVADLSGRALGDIGRYCELTGRPAIVWATIGMAQPPLRVEATWTTPAGRLVEWRSPEHALLLVGTDAANYYFNDPLAGPATPYPTALAQAAFDALGRQALAIELP
ncbi:MAG: C39 family peptidase [Bifidobacteriaceae bacterium]|jgi:uncharacterized protein YvpB|nr:C39 family peptidase [Bifidobacteriaceae bacterium]